MPDRLPVVKDRGPEYAVDVAHHLKTALGFRLFVPSFTVAAVFVSLGTSSQQTSRYFGELLCNAAATKGKVRIENFGRLGEG
jgi:hypothetical protein